MGESERRNILVKEDGFNTRVNLFIIRHMYYHMKKAEQFMVEGEGKRKKSVDLKTYISISAHRFTRMYKGENFELTADESKTIANCFNISADYFKKEGELIPVYGITRDDWKCYFYTHYGEDVSVWLVNTPSQKKEGEKKVADCLKKIINKKYIISHYDMDAPLYRIYYFFENGIAYKGTDILNKLLEDLKLLKISNWKEFADDPEMLKEYLYLLEKHCKYLKSYLECRELEQTN